MRKIWMWFLGMVIVLMVGIFVGKYFFPPPGPMVLANRPECPHSWNQVFDTTKYYVPTRLVPLDPNSGQFSLPGKYTSVPEFHDCQRLISMGLTYQPMSAVFLAVAVIEGTADPALTTTQPVPLVVPQQTNVTVPNFTQTVQYVSTKEVSAQGFGQPYVEVVTEGDYPLLGIRQGFNCMYLRKSGSMWNATMVSTGLQEFDCSTLRLQPGMTVTPLLVDRGTADEAAGDVPPVTRWDWDPVRHIQLIGVPCENRWCTVGPTAGFAALGAHGTAAEARQKRVKGWYDEQLMADYDPSNNLVVSTDTGTIFPVGDIATYTRTTYDATWKVVAFAALANNSTTYLTKYGFHQASASGALESLNQISLCMGTYDTCRIVRSDLKSSCQTGWWAKTQFGTDSPRYFCVAYRHYPGVTIPPVTRWRWRVKDETIWIPCPNGCCEVDSNEK